MCVFPIAIVYNKKGDNRVALVMGGVVVEPLTKDVFISFIRFFNKLKLSYIIM